MLLRNLLEVRFANPPNVGWKFGGFGKARLPRDEDAIERDGPKQLLRGLMPQARYTIWVHVGDGALVPIAQELRALTDSYLGNMSQHLNSDMCVPKNERLTTAMSTPYCSFSSSP